MTYVQSSSRLLVAFAVATAPACAPSDANGTAPAATVPTSSDTSSSSSVPTAPGQATSSPAVTTPSNPPTATPPTVTPPPTASQPASTTSSTPPSTSPTDTSSDAPSSGDETVDATDSVSTSDQSTASTASSEEPTEAAPSPGCGKSGRPNDGKIYAAGQYWLTFPPSYDGTKPMPLLFGFHGCGGDNRGNANRTEYTDLTQNNVLGRDYVVAAPISSDSGGCWNYNTDVVRAKQLYDEIVANYCVDTERVFATGHSSGAQFIVQLMQGNHSADAAHFGFRGVAPVAASAYNHSTAVAVMYIQSQNDTVRGGSGKDVVDNFVAANKCSNASSPYVGVDECQSGGTRVDPGCVQYEGCDVPTVWCSHNDPQYTNTGHGVPCFAAQGMDHFFKSL